MYRWEGTPMSTVSPLRAKKRVGANQVSYSVFSTTCSRRSRTCRQTFMDGGDLYLSDNPQVFHSCGKSFHGIGGRSLVAVGWAKQGVLCGISLLCNRVQPTCLAPSLTSCRAVAILTAFFSE